MKNENLISTLCALVIITGAILKIMHLPYANQLLLLGFNLSYFYQSWIIKKLKNINKELEAKLKVQND